jgi:hypothetical protein
MALGELLDTLASRSVSQENEIRRLAGSNDKLDQYLAAEAERQRRGVEDGCRSNAQLDAARNRETQIRADQVLEQFGERMSPPVVGEDPAAYQRHAMLHLKRKLAKADERPIDSAGTRIGEIAAVTIKHLPDSLLDQHERMLAAAAKVQAEAPHHDTLPAPGQFTTIVKTDSMTGAKEIRHFGKESFIAGLARKGRRVARIVDPVNKIVIWGQQFPRAE